MAPQGDPAEVVQGGDRGLQVLPTHVVEVHVDALRSGRGQQRGHVPVPVVEGCVEAELAAQELHLLRRSGAADHSGTAELGDLTHHRTDCARGGGDEHHVSFPQTGHVQ